MILNFEDELGPRHFEFVFVGFVLGGSIQEKKGLSVLRTEVAIFEKLESISDPRPDGRKLVNGEVDRVLKNGTSPKQLQMSMTEYDMIHQYVSAVPWQTGTPVRNAVEMIDWLERTQKESVK